MIADFARVQPTLLPLPLLAAGSAVFAFALVSPFGEALTSAFAEGWLAVYLDGAAFRLFCL